jgi:hypothetical protein
MARAKKSTVLEAEEVKTEEVQTEAVKAPEVVKSPARQAMDEEAVLREKRAKDDAKRAENPAKTQAEAIADSRKALEQTLPTGMAFYESPEGFIVVAEAGRGTVWCHHADNGKGMKINPRR